MFNVISYHLKLLLKIKFDSYLSNSAACSVLFYHKIKTENKILISILKNSNVIYFMRFDNFKILLF